MAKNKPEAEAKQPEAGSTDTTAETTTAGTVPTGNVEETAGAAGDRKRAPAANFLAIVRGRLPLVFVHAVRFDEVISAMSNKDLAAKLSTSVGKVFDIKKGRNFGYVGKEWKPTAEDIQAGKDWAGHIGQANAKELTAAGDKAFVEKIVADYEARGLATAEEAAAFSAARGETRKKSEAKAPAAGAAPAEGGAAAAGAESLLS